MSDFSLTKAVEEELLCHLCYDLLKDPRDLECPHVFCLLCIKKIIGNSVTIECPECRHVTFVPTDGMDSLKPNLRMRNMIEKFTSHTRKADENQHDDLLIPRCPHHPDEKLNFKCVECAVLVCQYCLVRNHQGHDIQECANNGILHEMKPAMNKYQIKVQRLKGNLRYLAELESTIARNFKSEEMKLDQQVQMLTADLQSKARTLKVRLSGMKKQKLARLHEQKAATKEQIRQIETAYTSTKSCTDSGDQNTEQTNLNDAFSSSCSLGTMSNISGHDLLDIRFQSSTRRGKASAYMLQIGQLVYKRKLVLSSEFGVGSFQKAQGIAVTHNGLLAVADSRANHVGVYCLEDSKYKRSFQLGAGDGGSSDGKITRPLDVGITSDGKFLVIDSSMVKLYSNDGRFEKAFRTGLQDIDDLSAPQGVTTTGSNGNDIIVIADLGRQVITLHKTSGAFIRMLKVDIDPRNRIATNGRHIFFTNYQEGKLCAIDFQSGEKVQQLDIPRVTAICLDEKSGSMILGRNDGSQGSGVIEQYCMTTGKLVARLASGLYAALGMTITDDDQLIVADMISVKVYSIKDC